MLLFYGFAKRNSLRSHIGYRQLCLVCIVIVMWWFCVSWSPAVMVKSYCYF